MFADNPLDDHQPQTGAVGFGGKIGFKNPADVFRRNAVAGIHEGHRHMVRAGLGADAENAAGAHRLQRILDQVVKRLLQLGAVREALGEVGGQCQFDQNIAILDFPLQQRQRLGDDVVDSRALQVRLGGPDGTEKLVDDPIEPGDLLARDTQIFLEPGRLGGR